MNNGATASLLPSCFSVSVVFIGQSIGGGVKDIRRKTVRKAHFCKSERMRGFGMRHSSGGGTISLRMPQALLSRSRGEVVLSEQRWVRGHAADVRVCLSPVAAGLAREAAGQGHFMLGQRFFQNNWQEMSDRTVRKVVVIR